MAPPSQDLDARFAVFLNPIRDLTKNWEVDIAKYLEDYLVELSEVQITFDDGRTVMNFAEAAMLIQGSATVYSKKVEFLWQMVLQMIDLLSSKKVTNLNNPEKDGTKPRTSKHNASLDFEELNEMPCGKNTFLKPEEEEEEKNFKLLPSVPMHLVEKESEKSVVKIPIYAKNLETIGNRDDFRVNRCFVTPFGLLSLDAPVQKLELEPEDPEKSFFGFNVSTFSQVLGSNRCPSPGNEDIVDDVDIADAGVDPIIDEPPMEPEPEVDVPAPGSPEEAQPDAEVPGPSSEEQENRSVETRSSLRKRREPEKTAELNLKDPLKPLDPFQDAPAKRPVRAGRIRRPVPCNCHREPAKTTRRTKALKEKEEQTGDSKDGQSIEQFLNKELTDLFLANSKVETKGPFPIDPRLVHEAAAQDLKRAEALKDKKVKDILETGEGHPRIPLSEAEAKERAREDTALETQHQSRVADDFPDDVPDIDFNDVDDEIELPEPHAGLSTPFGVLKDPEPANRSLNDSLMYEPSSEYEALVQKWVGEYINKAQEHVNSSELSKRVNRWRRRIGPVIVDEEKRKGFDIHRYGSDVLSQFNETEGAVVPFSQLVKGLESREVSRTFLSCLMLANTYNIGVNEMAPLEMDGLQLTLLSKVRHHERMEEDFTGSPGRRKKKSKRKSSSPSGSEDGSVVAGSTIRAQSNRRSPPKKVHKRSKRK